MLFVVHISWEIYFCHLFLALNHKPSTTIQIEETPVPVKPLPVIDYKLSQQSSTGSNNLLKPESVPWNANPNENELMRNKSQSISNIAGRR